MKRLASVGGSVLVLVALSIGLVVATSGGSTPTPADAALPRYVPAPTATVTSAVGNLTPYNAPLVVEAKSGALASVQASSPDGTALAGDLQPDGSWRSRSTLVPSTDYALVAVVLDPAGQQIRLPLTTRSSPAGRLLSARLSPGDDAVVGVGQPATVDLDRPVHDPASRALVERRLSVTSSPAATGSWRWLNDTQLHYRPETFWKPGTTVRVDSALQGLALPDGTWGGPNRTTTWRVGAALVSTVDVTAHTMTVTRDGQVLRVMKASLGSPQFPTLGGTHLVLEKNANLVMDSSTIGLPGAYRTEVEWAVRLTYSGTFTHAAPWSVPSQGVANVSHGCVNLSTEDAKWFYDLSSRGDVVQVVNAVVGPNLDDPGSADWNLDYATWQAGSALR